MESVGAWIDRFVDPSTRARGGDDLRRALTYGLAGEEMDIAVLQLNDICGIEWEE